MTCRIGVSQCRITLQHAAPASVRERARACATMGERERTGQPRCQVPTAWIRNRHRSRARRAALPGAPRAARGSRSRRRLYTSGCRLHHHDHSTTDKAYRPRQAPAIAPLSSKAIHQIGSSGSRAGGERGETIDDEPSGVWERDRKTLAVARACDEDMQQRPVESEKFLQLCSLRQQRQGLNSLTSIPYSSSRADEPRARVRRTIRSPPTYSPSSKNPAASSAGWFAAARHSSSVKVVCCASLLCGSATTAMTSSA